VKAVLPLDTAGPENSKRTRSCLPPLSHGWRGLAPTSTLVLARDVSAASLSDMARQATSQKLSIGALSLGMVFLAMCLPACESSEPANGTLQCGTTDPRCPSGEECVAATNTCWKIGTYDGGVGVDGAASLDGSLSVEAGHPLDSALPVDLAAIDVPLSSVDGAGAADAADIAIAIDTSVDQSIDVGKDASDAKPAADMTPDGLASLSCSELSTAYDSALAKARVCTVKSTGACAQTVRGGIQCGCNVPIDGTQTSAIATMDALRKAWTDKACTTVCPAIYCILYTGATCSSDGSTTGTCVGTLTTLLTP